MKRRAIPFYCLLPAFSLSVILLSSCHSAKRTARKKLKEEDKKIAAAKKKAKETHSTASYTSSGSKNNEGNINKSTKIPERESGITGKYASMLGVSKGNITNTDLYNFIDLWYGTPYKWAGRSRSGVDCSDFASLLERGIYNITISGTCTDIYKSCKPIKASQLKEGDLVFFKINSQALSHVGVYLQNNKFVHASVHSGVVISDLGEDYYKKFFWGAGRLK